MVPAERNKGHMASEHRVCAHRFVSTLREKRRADAEKSYGRSNKGYSVLKISHLGH